MTYIIYTTGEYGVGFNGAKYYAYRLRKGDCGMALDQAIECANRSNESLRARRSSSAKRTQAAALEPSEGGVH